MSVGIHRCPMVAGIEAFSLLQAPFLHCSHGGDKSESCLKEKYAFAEQCVHQKPVVHRLYGGELWSSPGIALPLCRWMNNTRTSIKHQPRRLQFSYIRQLFCTWLDKEMVQFSNTKSIAN